jgi:hypothetical protein
LNRDALLLADMIKACDKVAVYIQEGKEAFLSDERTQDAVIRNIEIIGEASKQLSAEAKGRAPQEPWKRIGGMRDKLIHHYFGVDLEVVWATAATILPPFRETAASLLTDLRRSSE